MNIRYRPIQPKDIGKCVEHLGRHPILGPRYGRLIEDLPAAMKCSLRDDYVVINVFEESHGAKTRFLGAGMAVFVHDDFLREVKTTKRFWIGPQLVKRIVRGKSPLLSVAEVRDANSAGSLNLMVWHNTCHAQDLVRMEVATTIMKTFTETFRGFHMREVFGQADCLEQFWGVREAGGFYFDRVRGYISFPDLDASSFSEEPRNYGITRELAGGSWVSSLFACGPPRFGFSRGEQRLLLSALTRGATDEELSGSLKISVFAVKKTWRSIYDRVATCLPELVPSASHSGEQSQSRGKQKKQRLLAYIREHPEELRPVSRRLLPQGEKW